MRRGALLMLSGHFLYYAGRGQSAAVANVLSDLALDTDGLVVETSTILDSSTYMDRLGVAIIDTAGRNEWLPAIGADGVLPRLTLDELRKLRMAWLHPEGVS